jgi:hypothetical protein
MSEPQMHISKEGDRYLRKRCGCKGRTTFSGPLDRTVTCGTGD